MGPREAQAITNLNYHLEAIRRSQILKAYLDYKGGRQQLADTYYRFANRSMAKAYGIYSQVDGGDLTVASLEEVDDMPRERLFSRFLLMMGATRRLGASSSARTSRASTSPASTRARTRSARSSPAATTTCCRPSTAISALSWASSTRISSTRCAPS